MSPSNELEAFFEYVTVTKSLSKKTIEAYRNDLLHLEKEYASPLIQIKSEEIFSLLSQY